MFGFCNIMAANRTNKEVDQQKCCSNNVRMDWIKSCHPMLSLILLHVDYSTLSGKHKKIWWYPWGRVWLGMVADFSLREITDRQFYGRECLIQNLARFWNTALLKLPEQKGEYRSPPGLGMSQLDGAGTSPQSLRIIRNKMDLQSHFPIFDVPIIGVSQLLKFTNI